MIPKSRLKPKTLPRANPKDLVWGYNLPPNLRGGFTLVEILVAIGIFSIVVTIAVGGFVQALKTYRQALAIMAANSNISSALEQIAREIRTGSNFDTSGLSPCLPPPSLCFDNANGEYVQYAYDSASRAITRGGLSSVQKITDSNVIVNYLIFTKYNLDPALYPPRISINIGIRPNIEGVDKGIIDFQTTISSRNF